MRQLLGAWPESVDLLAQTMPANRLFGQAQRPQHTALRGMRRTHSRLQFLCFKIFLFLLVDASFGANEPFVSTRLVLSL